ncbi:FAD-dependent oxidoreductase [Sedimentitalea sp. JM2-8]|uniref:FAD-dependent oxidoreductase n=1 Tax=Sedimentitalea xiamensis TaxID=3050037 RepID=A0ABT7FKF0_9RHOB|nr:FAD-dependent oxidoreductase [Sedimentitalea xiamensis]MDK3075440.1 FAD-dependent oxidoreductase [Sedimentitalea xiamensis]
MTHPIPTQASAVIIGGGIAGCSVAYHLAKLGWKDVVLLERKQLTSGTTWHAAGLIAQLRATRNMTRLSKYSQELYGELEEETGVATGFRRNGSITVALTDERREEIYRQASMARAFGVEVNELALADLQSLYPHINPDGFAGAVHLPKDGQGDPGNIALALAKGARMRGAQIREQVRVTAIHETVRNGRRAVSGVTWEKDETGESGTIGTDFVVNCAGMWAAELGRRNGVCVPLQACEHFYIVTENIAGLTQLPTLRVPDECAYYKEDAGKILLGAFEPVSKPWGMDGIPDDFCFDQLPEDFEHFAPILEQAVNRMPLLESAGIHTFFNGPESFTPDDAYHLGEAPEVRGYFVAAGFNSVGIQSSGGAGMALAHWMDRGYPPFDLSDVDIRRMQPFMGNRTYLVERAKETLGLLYADHFPYRQKATARGVRRAPFHDQFRARGAVFGETAGWERPNWFAVEGQEREYRYSWQRQNWFDNSAAEHRAIRENVGLYDMTSFGKITVDGRDAEAFLNHVCGADMSVSVGKIVYTQFLNDHAGIEADVTVSRLSETCYLVVTPAATVVRDMSWLTRHRGDFAVSILDTTAAEGVLAIMGPRARDLMQAAAPWQDWSNDAHPFGTARQIEIGLGLARAHRVSYVGELGWEIYVSSDQCAHVLDTVLDAGRALDLKLCGLHAMDSCRIEKGFRHFGHDITEEDHVLEAGLGFAVKTSKPDFIGRDAVLRRKEEGLACRMLQFRLTDPEPLLFHAEPILRDGQIVGHLTSGAYGHTLGGAVGLGYVPCKGEDAARLLSSHFEIEIAGNRVTAEASLKPLYDPGSARTKS